MIGNVRSAGGVIVSQQEMTVQGSNELILGLARTSQGFPFGLILEPVQARNGDYCNIARPACWRSWR